jgi:hypothetical protein
MRHCYGLLTWGGFPSGALTTNEDDGVLGGNLPGQIIHSFIIKIWREEAEKGKPPQWRGHITHVPGNERCYLKTLEEVSVFILDYLQRMGVNTGLRWRLKHWLKKRKSI